jgi:DNA mismatch endonuclease, patch repair protein
MADSVDPTTRSYVMSRVRAKDSTLETKVRLALWNRGLRYRKNVRSLPGCPDMVCARRKIVVFIDSCFWHGCPEHCRMPATNRDYWQKKIAANRARDEAVTRHYAERGWRCVRFWEHDLRSDFDRRVDELVALWSGDDTP